MGWWRICGGVAEGRAPVEEDDSFSMDLRSIVVTGEMKFGLCATVCHGQWIIRHNYPLFEAMASE
jgi:hypothetical protein